jgi:hypothetical protein
MEDDESRKRALFQESITTPKSQKNRPTTPRGMWVLRGRAPNFQGINSMLWRAGKKPKESQTWYMYEMNYKVS